MMKRKFIILFLLCPAIAWAQPKAGPNRMVIVFAAMGGQPCEIISPGVGKQQIGPNLVLAGIPVIVGVVATTPTFGPVSTTRRVLISVLDPATLPFLSGALNENKVWDTLTFFQVPFAPGYYGDSCVITPWRATTHQRGAYPKDITEYRFIVKDPVLNVTDTLLPDTSSSLDSVIPGAYTKLLLRLPGESHYPGDQLHIGKRGMPLDWDASLFYDCWVYATDNVHNAVPYNPFTGDTAVLEVCLSTLTPDSINPRRGLLFTEVPHNTVVDSVAKKLFKVSYPAMGHAGLKARGIPSGIQSNCEHFRITGPAPDPEDQIRVIPNPCGTPGHPAIITILRVPIGGGRITGRIYDSFGYLVRDFSKELMDQSEKDPFAKFWRIEWDVRNDKGHRVDNGCYHLCVEIIQVEKAGVWKEKIGVVW